MTEPVDMKKLGGLSYNANLVSSAKKLKNGKFEIIFKTGEKVVYPQQTNSNSANIKQTIAKGSLIYDDTSFNITNVMGATFTSSKDTVSRVILDDSSNTTIDLSANNSKWYGDSANVRGGKNNKVILDKEDTATIDGNDIKGQGTAAQKDYKPKW